MIVIVDTNVLVVANGRDADQASDGCRKACVAAVKAIINEQNQILLDDNFEILREYLRNARREGQPGVGDELLKWLLTNRNSSKVITQHVTPVENNRLFDEFPDDERLKKFDPSDRKFVAVALSHQDHPPIQNAVDTDWWIHRDILEEHGISIDFLCESDIKRLLSQIKP